MLAAALLVAFAAGAGEVVLRDGTVIEVASHRVTGSHVWLTLPDGRQVAYDVADVDPASLAAPAPQPEAGATAPATTSLGGLASGLALEERSSTSSIRITDADVERVRPRGGAAAGAEDDGEAETAGLPEGYAEGAGVALNSVEMSPLEEGAWRVSGEVVNRSPQLARNVRIRLEVGGPTPRTVDFDVTASLPPDQRAVFEHSFPAELEAGESQPATRLRVIWLQDETRREPTFTRFGQGGPPIPDVVAPRERPLH